MLPQGISSELAEWGIKVIEVNYSDRECSYCNGTGKTRVFKIIPCDCPECSGKGTTRVYSGPSDPFDPMFLAIRKELERKQKLDKCQT